MSISPQSLARTRDKRSLRIPRKFEDFSLVTSSDLPDVSHTRNAQPPPILPSALLEATLKKKVQEKRKRHTIGGDKVTPEPSLKKPATSGNNLDKSSAAKTATHSATVSPDSADSNAPTPTPKHTSSTNSHAPTSKKAAKKGKTNQISNNLSNAEKAMKNAANHQVAQPKISTSTSPATTITSPVTEPDEIELECTEIAPKSIDNSTEKMPVIMQKLMEDDAGGSRCSCGNKSVSFVDVLDGCKLHGPNAPKPTNYKSIDEKLLRQSPFHPSVTIRNGSLVRKLDNEDGSTKPQIKPLSEKKTIPLSNIATPPSTATPKSVSRKKSKGLSLMAKPQNPNKLQQASNSIPNIIQNNNGVVINGTNQGVRSGPTQNKYYTNSLNQNMQYGRLMFNEPIYLPRSVGPIAPITTTLQQIANLARKPPFLTKKAEACLAYQNERKMDLITSSHRALITITKYLDVKDLLNLRLVSKTWKSIVDSDAVWKTVRLNKTKVTNWKKFASKILGRYHTNELILDEIPVTTSEWSEYSQFAIEALCNPKIKLNKLEIRTVNELQSKFAFELTFGLRLRRNWDREFQMSWLARVEVDNRGYAKVPIRREICIEEGFMLDLNNVNKFTDANLNDDDSNTTAFIEISDIESLIRNEPGSIHSKASLKELLTDKTGEMEHEFSFHVKPI